MTKGDRIKGSGTYGALHEVNASNSGMSYPFSELSEAGIP
jgi:hypothetical protein